MAPKVYATLKQILEEFFNPHFDRLREEIALMRRELASQLSGSMDVLQKIDALRNELRGDIARIDQKLTFTSHRLDEALEIRGRLSTLETRVRRS